MFSPSNNIKRIVVTGNSPGSGKTYISRLLCRLTGLPIYHLDRIFWKKDWENVTEDEFLRLQNEIICQENWILEGGYINSLRHRAIHADMVIVIKAGKWQSLWRVIKRRFKNHGIREDLPEGCNNKVNLSFLLFIIKTFHLRYDRIMQQLADLNIPIHVIKDEKALYDLFQDIRDD